MMCACGHMCHGVCVWRTEDDWVELVLPFHLYMGTGFELRSPGLHSKYSHPLNHLSSKIYVTMEEWIKAQISLGLVQESWLKSPF